MQKSKVWKKLRMYLLLLLAAVQSFSYIGKSFAQDGETTESSAPPEAGGTSEASSRPGEGEVGVFPDNLSRQGYDVVFCIDNSGSVWNQQKIRNQALRSIGNLAVGSDIRIGGVYFGDKIYKNRKSLTPMWETEESQELLTDFFTLTEQDEENRDTNIGVALEAARELLENQDASRKQIIILFSDGINENMAGDDEFKKAADQKTEEQAKLLEEDGIPIYCVFLEKDRKDEDYLRRLVNYFDEGNSYDEERFQKVTDAQIRQLSDLFAQVFYSMQNNMKYGKFSMDSSGVYPFYVPELGVEKLQVYVNNPSGCEVVLKNASGAVVEPWGDGENLFFSVENPAVREWRLEAQGDYSGEMTGTLAYYASPRCHAVLVSDGNAVTDCFKNDTVKVRAYVWGGTGDVLQADPAAQVTATVAITDRYGRESKREMVLGIAEEGFESEEFVLDTYGSYRIQVNLQYENFIDFDYNSLGGGKIQGRPPVPHDQDGFYMGDKAGDGVVFSFKTESLCGDPDGDDIRLIDVVQLKEDNPVGAVQEGNVIKLTASKNGAVDVLLNFEDETGKKASAAIVGNVIDRGLLYGAAAFLLGVLLAFIFYFLLSAAIKKSLKKKVSEGKAWFREADKEVQKLQEEFRKLAGSKKRNQFKEVQNEFRQLCEDRLTKAQLEEYGAGPYLCRPEENKDNKAMAELEAEMKSKGAELYMLNSSIEKSSSGTGVRQLRKSVNQMKRDEQSVRQGIQWMGDSLRAYQGHMDGLEQDMGQMSEKYCDICQMLEEPIACNLVLRWGKYMGVKICRNAAGCLKGYYRLDEDVKFMGPGEETTLGRLMEDRGAPGTGILVYGYQDEGGNLGLRFQSDAPFCVGEMGKDSDMLRRKSVVLLSGGSYRLKLDDLGMVAVDVERGV